MKSSHILYWLMLLAIPAITFSTTANKPANAVTIKGNIVQKNTNKSIANAYLYIVPGEEETLSRNNGTFTIATWQHLPVVLVIEHALYKQKKITLQNASEGQLIQLDPK